MESIASFGSGKGRKTRRSSGASSFGIGTVSGLAVTGSAEKKERIEVENVQGWNLWLHLSVLIEVPCSRVDERGKSLRGDTAMSLVQFTESTHSNISFYHLIESIY